MKRTRLFISVLMLLLIIWGVGYVRFIAQIDSLKPEHRGQKTDAIVVLTGGNYRIHTGLKLFAEGLAPRLLITGVHKSVRQEDILASWKENEKLPDCCMTLGRDATTTIGNAREAKSWAREHNIRSMRIVTSAYHMPRALIEFHHAMPNIEIISHPVEEQDYAHDDVRFWLITFSEYNKNLLRQLSLLVLGE